MLINSVIFVLREVLEAALLVSLLLVFSGYLGRSTHWLRWSVLLGLIGVIAYTASMNTVTEWLDGTGQEVVNATLQICVWSLIVFLALAMSVAREGHQAARQWCTLLMGAAIAVAMVREGSEILIYVTGFGADESLRNAVLTGGVIGASIGLSAGVLLYYFFYFLVRNTSMLTALVPLGLVGAGMIMQASLLLDQAGLLDYQAPLWNMDSILSEQSITGQLLYAVFGYEATPTPLQVGLYFGSLLVISAAAVAGRYLARSFTLRVAG